MGDRKKYDQKKQYYKMISKVVIPSFFYEKCSYQSDQGNFFFGFFIQL